MQINTKTPISYYGGKQNMLQHILPLIPEHKLYCEPFFGGGALYFAKQPSQIEVINDKNDFVINFYRVLKTRFDELKAEVEASLSSRSIHRKAAWIMKNPAGYDEVKLAWACWYLANYSFSGKITGGWKYDRTQNKDCQGLLNRKRVVNPNLVRRIELTQIECEEAVKVIKSRDNNYTFFYLDPPYIDTDQGHYKGYTKEHFIILLTLLSQIKGQFMLSCFPSDIVYEFITLYQWKVKEFDKVNSSSHVLHYSSKPRKTELLVMNYTITSKQLTAF